MKTFFCISTYYKGGLFLEALKEQGHRVIFLTSDRLRDADWPRDSIDEIYYAPELRKNVFDLRTIELGFAAILRHQKIDAIVALDDFDVEKAAHLREQFRIGGMGQTTHRYFRDKLAMRARAKEVGIEQPRFSAVFNNEEVSSFIKRVDGPWVLKPRSQASASGIQVVEEESHLWNILEELGDERHLFLLEEYIVGDVYHSDALSYGGEVLFQRNSKYLIPPFQVVKDGGIFQSLTCDFEGADNVHLDHMNRQLLSGFGMLNSASHTEYIYSPIADKFYFLETSARVGGAHLSEMLEAATGVNLWREWARMEIAVAEGQSYTFPETNTDHAGILMSTCPQEYPSYDMFTQEEIVWTAQQMKYHTGMIIQHVQRDRVREIMGQCAQQIAIQNS